MPTLKRDRTFARVITSHTLIESGKEPFGLTDDRGREIGYAWTIHKITTADKPDNAHGWYHLPSDAPELFESAPHPTRNGQHYGALTPRLYSETIEGIRALIADRMARAKYRYAKLYPVRP
jgi:hypothetical protein